MTKRKSTKRTLLLSALSLLLCVSMLISSTFAWFTDSVTSGNNKIVSGSLKIDLELLDKTSGTWSSIKNNQDPIFDYDKWEPGYTDVKILKVENEGTLALKWIAKFVSNEDLSILADVIDVYVKPSQTEPKYPTNRNDLTGYTRVGTVAEFVDTIEETTYGSLKADEKAYLGIALKMQESADNKYQDLKLGAFDIQILATQLTHEFDSFDNQYDADAILGTYIELNAGDDLLAAMASAEPDMPLTIKLNCDVEWPTEGHLGENDITPASSIVIDGNGYTITATGSGVTPLGDTEAPMTLKNVKIVDNSVSYAESAWEFTYLELGGTSLNCNNVTFADEIQLGTNATFTNCSFESNEESVYAVWVENGSAAFNNCTFTGYRGLKVHEAYGSEVNTIVVKDCTFSNITKKPGIALGTLNADTTVSITGSTFINCQAGDQSKYIYETDTDVTTFNFVENNNNVSSNASSSEELNDALDDNALIYLPEGEYNLSSLNNFEGVTIVGGEGAVIGGENSSTGFGSNFGKNTTIKNLTFSGTTNGVRYSYANGGTTTFDNCTFAGDSTYGFHIDQSNGATFIFNECTFKGFNAFAGDLVKVVFNNCTFLSNGNYGHTNIWSVAEFNNCTWGDKTSVGQGKDSGAKLYFNDVEESYHHEFIGSAESLFDFAKSVNEGNDSWTGQKVLLVADIDLENAVWTPIGQTGSTTFAGSFDGQGYTISNLTVDSSAKDGKHYSSGLFGWIEIHGSKYTVIKNLNVDSATITGNHNCGTIVGYATGSVEIKNCNVSNATITCNVANEDANGDKAGVIAGNITAEPETKVTNCTASNSTVTAGRDAGQLVGAGNTENVTGTATNVTVTANGQGTGANINNALVGRNL